MYVSCQRILELGDGWMVTFLASRVRVGRMSDLLTSFSRFHGRGNYLFDLKLHAFER